jgi:hypothetical protein
MLQIPPVAPATADTLPLPSVLSYAERLVNRRDTYAVQQSDGRYLRVAVPLDQDALVAHLTGARTVACYALDRQRQARWLCFDSDAPEGLAQLLLVHHALAALGLTTLREASRRGGHLWLFCAQAVPAAVLRGSALGVLALLAARGDLPDAVARQIEVYPSAAALGAGGYSQAVRAPLGVHQRTGLIYPFVDVGARPAHGLTVVDGLQWMLRQPVAPPALIRAASHAVERQLEDALDGVALALGGAGRPVEDASAAADLQLAPERTSDALRLPDLGAGRASLIAWVNAQVELPDLIAEMTPGVQLRPIGQGWAGGVRSMMTSGPRGRRGTAHRARPHSMSSRTGATAGRGAAIPPTAARIAR